MNNDYKIIKKCHSVKVTGKKSCLQSGLRLATSELPNLTPHKSMPKDGFYHIRWVWWLDIGIIFVNLQRFSRIIT